MQSEAERVNVVHHVVWCVEPGSLERVRAFWEEGLGVALEECDLPELGLRVLISWKAGIEIMTPAFPTGALVQAAREFLAERGEGVYTVVYNVRGIDDAVASLTRRGGCSIFRDTISASEVEERKLSDGERFSIQQAGFDEYCGMRICLQEIEPA